MSKPLISPLTIEGQDYDEKSFIIGLVLAISSSIFIGSSFIIKKLALRRINTQGSVRASAGGFSYLKQWLWWLGFITMGVGEAANLIAYAFAPAALVTPLGALSVLVAAVLASHFLKEKLNFIGKIGCFLCVVGSTVIVLHSPKEEEVKSFAGLTEKLTDPLFISYMITIMLISLSIKAYFGPKYGNNNVSIYLILCSAIGSLTVVFCKGIAIGIRETIVGKANNLTDWLFWTLLLSAILCIMAQMNYLNKSLDIFNTSIVTPVYYVMFTVLVIIASGILFREWIFMGGADILGCLCGFVIVIVAIFILNAFKDIKLSFKDLNMNSRRRRELDEINQGIYGSTQITRNV